MISPISEHWLYSYLMFEFISSFHIKQGGQQEAQVNSCFQKLNISYDIESLPLSVYMKDLDLTIVKIHTENNFEAI